MKRNPATVSTQRFRSYGVTALQLLGAISAAAWMLAVPAAGAQEIIDPTRPPPMSDTAGGAEGGGIGLQSVFISDSRRAAIIGGQVVELGQKYGDATLVRVTESEVTLAKGRETQVLHLFPGIDKKMITAAPEPAVPAGARRKNKSRGNK